MAGADRHSQLLEGCVLIVSWLCVSVVKCLDIFSASQRSMGKFPTAEESFSSVTGSTCTTQLTIVPGAA